LRDYETKNIQKSINFIICPNIYKDMNKFRRSALRKSKKTLRRKIKKTLRRKIKKTLRRRS
jgi:hypothetical protein